MREYNLPEWAFLDAHSHLGDTLNDRTVVLHIRSASVIEIIDRDDDSFIPNEDVIVFKFKYISESGIERLSAILHYSATLSERENIITQVLRPCAKWYCDYCAWEDNNIINGYYGE